MRARNIPQYGDLGRNAVERDIGDCRIHGSDGPVSCEHGAATVC